MDVTRQATASGVRSPVSIDRNSRIGEQGSESGRLHDRVRHFGAFLVAVARVNAPGEHIGRAREPECVDRTAGGGECRAARFEPTTISSVSVTTKWVRPSPRWKAIWLWSARQTESPSAARSQSEPAREANQSQSRNTRPGISGRSARLVSVLPERVGQVREVISSDAGIGSSQWTV